MSEKEYIVTSNKGVDYAQFNREMIARLEQETFQQNSRRCRSQDKVQQGTHITH